MVSFVDYLLDLLTSSESEVGNDQWDIKATGYQGLPVLAARLSQPSNGSVERLQCA